MFPESQEHAALANVPEIKNGTLLAQPPADHDTLGDDTETGDKERRIDIRHVSPAPCLTRQAMRS